MINNEQISFDRIMFTLMDVMFVPGSICSLFTKPAGQIWFAFSLHFIAESQTPQPDPTPPCFANCQQGWAGH
jgi:hypothetical protein